MDFHSFGNKLLKKKKTITPEISPTAKFYYKSISGDSKLVT
jgi:hypothetical protein